MSLAGFAFARAALGTAGIGLVCSALVLLVQVVPAEGQAVPGTLVSGRPIPGGVEPTAWLQQHVPAFEERKVRLKLPDLVLTESFGNLGIRFDVRGTEQRLRERTRGASLWQRLRTWRRANQGLEQVAASWTWDARRAERALEAIAEGVRREPIDASIDLEEHTRTAPQVGRELDLPATLRVLSQLAEREGDELALVTRELTPSVLLSDLLPVDVSQVLSSFETDFAKNAGPRTHNIRRAAAYLNGKVLPPRKLFSFNRTVGPREKKRGFIEAPVIVRDEFEKDYGGGVCQVASTLHAAAVYGGLEVIERRSHSRPIGYTPMGLDAVVIDGKADLKFKNPYDVPILIHAFLPEKTRVRIELLGRPPPLQARHIPRVLERDDFMRRVVRKLELPSGMFRKRQRGRQGYQVESSLILSFENGRRVRRKYQSRYYPVPEVFWVSRNFDIRGLPPLPEGAIGVEEVSEEASGAEP